MIVMTAKVTVQLLMLLLMKRIATCSKKAKVTATTVALFGWT
jgi:hypothetical protein